jgi:hypothetical protein
MEIEMNVIQNTTLLVRRLNDLQRRREALVDRQDRLRQNLPDWAFAPLQLVGMTAEEIRGVMTDLSQAESDCGLDELEKDLEQIDQRIEEIENLLLAAPTRSLDDVSALLDLALHRFRQQTAVDPTDIFYDYGDARVLAFLERASNELREVISEGQRNAS